jgi:hypothetical protein
MANTRSRIGYQTRQALMNLYRVDLSYEVDLLRIERSNLSIQAKEARKVMIVLEHREKRHPHVIRLTESWTKE